MLLLLGFPLMGTQARRAKPMQNTMKMSKCCILEGTKDQFRSQSPQLRVDGESKGLYPHGRSGKAKKSKEKPGFGFPQVGDHTMGWGGRPGLGPGTYIPIYPYISLYIPIYIPDIRRPKRRLSQYRGIGDIGIYKDI